MDIKDHVCGIPAIIRVLDWEPRRPGRLFGPPEDCYPDEGGYGEWKILDRNKRPAPWLEVKLIDDPKEHDRIEELVFDTMESTQDDYDY